MPFSILSKAALEIFVFSLAAEAGAALVGEELSEELACVPAAGVSAGAAAVEAALVGAELSEELACVPAVGVSAGAAAFEDAGDSGAAAQPVSPSPILSSNAHIFFTVTNPPFHLYTLIQNITSFMRIFS